MELVSTTIIITSIVIIMIINEKESNKINNHP